ncbi:MULTISPECIES: acetyl/propionyl/methylcrotonyl-CoA carboxylase subunit alpha [unclassified Iodidimonas]|jgi:3-methylcrotonyl-CoA carboxylase alpha subunit|uniref:acetyl/propionyl/methylcrotonyl-CoA carboxylase subunit alpha n=1 Tax=unclassified Iodidimonas TaxID=2626145 RepID=UPI002482D0B3|nr:MULTISPECIES: acetyl/propionyl/methylcrotonyl-CoA carboxylase subunit alpha [unclassified Iodidimonas]
MSRHFKKILIANRGEIACRVIRTARAMDIASCAVYSDADAHALHVELADEAIHIGPSPAAQSYLMADKIIDAAKRCGADAIHPGYGFLSENADFAEKCAAHNICFIGPTADNIRKMGLKDEAKRLMSLADVPVVPGYLGADQSPENLLEEAQSIGFPVLIKAVAGGGGKGMRRVDDAADFLAALKAAKREALGAFGNDHVLIEKFILKPRHIEVQVFADQHGHAVYLFERDCSLQRRHQKVVEEAPAPDMPPALRQRMGDAAVAAALAIGYQGAGTIEFIVDVANGLKDAPFYFMEMNTRLQVEHPVTEMISGEDLVEWQIRVAAGEPLPLDQGDLAIDGHAIEVRLYAEDPARDFLPASGTLQCFRPSLDEDFTRIDTGVREGDAISVHYDPMIAKIICWGEDRDAAISHLQRALAQTQIAGFATNLSFLQKIIDHPAFHAADLDTGFIPRHIDDLLPSTEPASPLMLALAALGIIAQRSHEAAAQAQKSADSTSPWHHNHGWKANLPALEHHSFMDASGREQRIEINFNKATGAISGVETGDHVLSAELRTTSPDGGLDIVLDGQILRATVLVDQADVHVFAQGGQCQLKRMGINPDADEEADGPGVVAAPMPGKILDLFVAVGDKVEKGQPLLVLEAMKMEHSLAAPRAGTVADIPIKAGDQVEDGARLIMLEDDTPS